VVGELDAIGYAKFRSRSHDAVTRVYDTDGKLIQVQRKQNVLLHVFIRQHPLTSFGAILSMKNAFS
jgi:hypothetical protein